MRTCLNKRRGVLVRWACPVAALAVLAFPCSASAVRWFSKDYVYRRLVVIEKLPRGAPAAHVRFAHLGALRKDGRDIRVANAAGRLVPHELLRLGPGDQAELLFHCKNARPGAVYAVYFGNPRALAPKAWTAPAGVVLEIRKKGRGGCDSWNRFQRLYRDSTEVLGRTLRPKIFDGYNPLGPNQNFVSYYRAYFRAYKKGTYKFATTSDDASFLLVNGRLVAQFPGWHGAWGGRWGQHNGTIRLDPGVHKLEYYHVQGTNESATVAAWQRPGDRHVRLMYEGAFVPVAQARAGAAERADGRPVLDFSWTPVDHLVVQGHYLIRYTLECRSRYRGLLNWDFGDGAHSSIRKDGARFEGRHLFLAPGRYTVRVSPGKDSSYAPLKQTLVVEPLWTQREEFNAGRWEAYKAVLYKRLAQGTVAPANLAAVLAFAVALEDKDLLAKVAARCWSAAARIPARDHDEIFFTLGLRLQKDLKDYAGAGSAFQEVLGRPGKGPYRARAKLHQAGLLIHVLGKNQAALELLKSIDEKDLPPPSEPVLKKIYIADALAGLGRREEAIRRYEGLRNVVPLTNRRYAARRRARLVAVESYIKRGDLEAALQELANIEWETPRERMADETGLLRTECYLAQKDYRRAAVLLERLLKMNPNSARVPEMMLQQIKAYRGLKSTGKINETYARLKKQYPYAGETALASLLLGK